MRRYASGWGKCTNFPKRQMKIYITANVQLFQSWFVVCTQLIRYTLPKLNSKRADTLKAQTCPRDYKPLLKLLYPILPT